jgi:hypothetical protein
MTKEEHQLMILMFARLHEAIEAISETLSSREIWLGDDRKAFQDLVRSDKYKLGTYVVRAGRDYLKLAKKLGVVTGIE